MLVSRQSLFQIPLGPKKFQKTFECFLTYVQIFGQKKFFLWSPKKFWKLFECTLQSAEKKSFLTPKIKVFLGSGKMDRFDQMLFHVDFTGDTQVCSKVRLVKTLLSSSRVTTSAERDAAKSMKTAKKPLMDSFPSFHVHC